MDQKNMMNIVRRLYDEVYAKGNIKALDDLCDKNLQFHDVPNDQNKVGGIHDFKELETGYHKAFPNKKPKIEDIFTNQDKVVVRWTLTGKNEGPFNGNPPTHRNATISGISIYRLENEKIVELWQRWDKLSLLEQLGIAVHAAH